MASDADGSNLHPTPFGRRARRQINDIAKARELSDRAIEVLRKTKKTASPALAAALELSGAMALDRGESEAGLGLGREAAAIREAAHGPNDHRVSRSLVLIATGLLLLERWTEAEEAARRSFSLRKAFWGAEAWQTYEDAHIISLALTRQKKFEEAEEIAEDTLDVMRKTLGSNARRTKSALLNYSGILRFQGKLDAAKALEAELKRP